MVVGFPVKSLSLLADDEIARLGASENSRNRFSGHYLLRRPNEQKNAKIAGRS